MHSLMLYSHNHFSVTGRGTSFYSYLAPHFQRELSGHSGNFATDFKRGNGSTGCGEQKLLNPGFLVRGLRANKLVMKKENLLYFSVPYVEKHTSFYLAVKRWGKVRGKIFFFFLCSFQENSIIHCPLKYKTVTQHKGFQQENLRILYTFFLAENSQCSFMTIL